MPGQIARPKAVFAPKLTQHGYALQGEKAMQRGVEMKSRESTGRAANASKKLAFGELEAFTRALLTVLLSLMCARIAREKTELLELAAQFDIELE